MSAADMFWAAPPISRTITAAAVLLSVPTWMGLIDPYNVVFITQRIFTFRHIPQLWRIITGFILTAPKLGLIMDPYFLYTYGSSLETSSPSLSQPGDFFTYIIFVATIILMLGGLVLDAPMLLSALTLAFAYTHAQDNPNMQVSYFIVTFSIKWLPYVMLLMTFVMASPGAAMIQATGLVAAHAYHFLSKIWPEYGGGKNYIYTPEFVRRWFAKPGMTPTRRGAGMTFNAGNAGRQTVSPQQPQAGSGGGRSWTSGFSGNGWGERGPGRRLGGE